MKIRLRASRDSATPAEATWHAAGRLRTRLLGKAWIAILPALIALFASACVGTPGYLIDIFPEMHYAPSYRPQEPPRLSPPADAVPITGKEPSQTADEAKVTANPLPQTPENLNLGVQVYMVNCAVCHGATGRGNGPMAERFAVTGATPPVDYTSPRVRGRTDGELFFNITNGIGLMPRFGPLLTTDERWALVQFIHVTQQ